MLKFQVHNIGHTPFKVIVLYGGIPWAVQHILYFIHSSLYLYIPPPRLWLPHGMRPRGQTECISLELATVSWGYRGKKKNWNPVLQRQPGTKTMATAEKYVWHLPWNFPSKQLKRSKLCICRMRYWHIQQMWSSKKC